MAVLTYNSLKCYQTLQKGQYYIESGKFSKYFSIKNVQIKATNIILLELEIESTTIALLTEIALFTI